METPKPEEMMGERTAEPIRPKGSSVDLGSLRDGDYDVILEADAKHEVIASPVRRTKVALVGFARASNLGLVPYEDQSWEVWSLNQHYRYMKRASRWFEIHCDFLSDQVEGTDYLAWLKTCPIPVYMSEPWAEIPQARKYPIEDFAKLAGIWEYNEQAKDWHPRDYIQSSLAPMLGLALLEGFETIGLYGIDLVVGQEYGYQKPNMEWLIGLAQGRGYTVTRGPRPAGFSREIHIPDRSALLMQTYRYGWEHEPKNALKPLLEERQVFLQRKLDEAKAALDSIDGQMNENRQWLSVIDMWEKGATVDWLGVDGNHRFIIPPGPDGRHRFQSAPK